MWRLRLTRDLGVATAAVGGAVMVSAGARDVGTDARFPYVIGGAVSLATGTAFVLGGFPYTRVDPIGNGGDDYHLGWGTCSP